MDTLDKDILIVYGLSGIASSVTDIHDFLDILLKMMLQEKGVTMDQKIDIATFIEINPSLQSSITDVEMIFSAMKNVFSIYTKDEYLPFQGQCLNSMTTILIQAIHTFEEQEVIGLFSEHLNFLWKMVKQVNNEKTYYVRSVAANCLTEMELCFPKLLDSCLDSLYTATVVETSVAHQNYLCLLVLAIKNSLYPSELSERLAVDHAVLKKQATLTVGGSESASSLYTSVPNINQVVSFVLDQLPFCSSVAVVWLIQQLTYLLKNSANSLPLLQPFVLSSVNTKNLPLLHLLCNLEKSFGKDIFSTHLKDNLSKQLVLNSLNSSFSVAHRLTSLDLLVSYVDGSSPESVAPILPSCFDGPETQLKKIHLLISVLGDKPESFQIIVPVIESLRKQTSLLKTVKMKSSLTKSLYKCVMELKSDGVNEKVASLLITAIDEDLSYIPFVLCFVSKVKQNDPSSPLPTKILDMLLLNFTQPAGQVSIGELKQFMPVFWSIVKQGEETGQAKVILVFFVKHILSTEICSDLPWDLGHEMLSFCQYLMKEYNTTEFYHELCETLKLFTSRCEDIDLQDRGHLYFSLLTHLSTKVLKNQKRRYVHSITPEISLYPNPTICTWDKPIFRLTKYSEKKREGATEWTVPYEGDLNKYYLQLSEFSAKHGFKIPCYLQFNQETSKNIHIVTAAAIQFKVDPSWGTVKDSLLGHLNKKVAREQKLGYPASVQCFPSLPHPVTAQVSTEFGFEDNCYVCSMDPFRIDFSDRFFSLPVEDGKREELFANLWAKCEASGCVSVNILPFPRETVNSYLDEQLESFIVSKTEDGGKVCVGIFLHPAHHLLAQFLVEEEDTTLRMATEDVYVLSLGSSFFKNLGHVTEGTAL